MFLPRRNRIKPIRPAQKTKKSKKSGMAARARKKRIVEKMPPPTEPCWFSLKLLSIASVSGGAVEAIEDFVLLPLEVDLPLLPGNCSPVALGCVDVVPLLVDEEELPETPGVEAS